MLIERTFTVGGGLCWGLAVLFAAALVFSGTIAIDPASVIVPALFGVIGSIFPVVGIQARRDRLALLALPTPVGAENADAGTPVRDQDRGR